MFDKISRHLSRYSGSKNFGDLTRGIPSGGRILLTRSTLSPQYSVVFSLHRLTDACVVPHEKISINQVLSKEVVPGFIGLEFLAEDFGDTIYDLLQVDIN
jgi:hypothetical protein